MPFDPSQLKEVLSERGQFPAVWMLIIDADGQMLWADDGAKSIFELTDVQEDSFGSMTSRGPFTPLSLSEWEQLRLAISQALRDGQSQFGWIDNRTAGEPIDWQVDLRRGNAAQPVPWLVLRGQDASESTRLRIELRKATLESDNQRFLNYSRRRKLCHEIRNCLAAVVGSVQVLELDLPDRTETLGTLTRNLAKLQELVAGVPIPLPPLTPLSKPADMDTAGQEPIAKRLARDFDFDAARSAQKPFELLFDSQLARDLIQQRELELERMIWLLYLNNGTRPEWDRRMRISLDGPAAIKFQLRAAPATARLSDALSRGPYFELLESVVNGLGGTANDPLTADGAFELVIPLKTDPAILETLQPPATVPEPHFEPPRDREIAEPPGGTVLIVDDQRDVRVTLQKLVTKFGLRVSLASDGESAVEIYRKPKHPGRLALVLLDLQLPGMSGVDTAKRLRQLGYRSTIVGITGGVEPDDRSVLREAGFDQVLEKPISVHALEQLLMRTGLLTAPSA